MNKTQSQVSIYPLITEFIEICLCLKERYRLAVALHSIAFILLHIAGIFSSILLVNTNSSPRRKAERETQGKAIETQIYEAIITIEESKKAEEYQAFIDLLQKVRKGEFF